MNPSPNPSIKKNNWKRTIPGIILSMLGLGVVIYFTDMRQFIGIIKAAKFGYFPIAILFFLISLSFRSLAWRTILYEKVTFGRLYLTINIGYLLNNVFPFRMGEIGRIVILGQSGVVDMWQVASSILVERILDILLAVTLFFIGLPFIHLGVDGGNSQSWMMPVGFTAASGVIIGLLMLFIIANQRQRINIVGRRISERWPIFHWVTDTRLDSFLRGLTPLTDVKRFIRTLVFMIFCWLAMVLEAVFIMKMFDGTIEWMGMVFAVGAASLGVAIPSSPGGIGILEASYVGSLALFGIETSKALAFAISAHMLYYVMTTILGLFGLSREGESLGRLYKRIERRRENANETN